MLKLIRGLVLSLVVIAMNAYVPPTYAASANVMVTHIQAGGAGAALQELIILHNSSSDEVDISGWCVKNKNNVEIGCFRPAWASERYYLAGGSYATLASAEFAQPYQPYTFSIIYTPANQSSGSIVGGADTISLFDQTGTVVDSHTWTTSLAGGTILARKPTAETLRYLDTDQASDWEVSILQGIPPDGAVRRDEFADFCLNIEGMQPEVPEGFMVDWDGNCWGPPPQLFITELLPNASGSDEGHEFIELYNPHDVEVSLNEYILKVGPSFDNSYNFPEGSVIGPHTYLSFDNAAIGYSLLNSSSRVQLASTKGLIIDETPSYQDPKDDMAWALIENVWQYAVPTPSLANQSSPVMNGSGEGAELQPCAPNQYRSPETNRCRLIAVPATQTPCKDGQYRSEETNRCRNIATDANMPKPCEEGEERNPETGRCRKIAVVALPSPCKAGQERNPETNRCRNIVAMTKADYAVLGTQTSSNGQWYIWAAIIGLLLVALGYAVWEWRYELRKLQVALWAKFARRRK